MDAHLPARENQTLLRWWDTGLLFNLLLNASDLCRSDIRRGHAVERRKVECSRYRKSGDAHLVVKIDIELNLNARQEPR